MILEKYGTRWLKLGGTLNHRTIKQNRVMTILVNGLLKLDLKYGVQGRYIVLVPCYNNKPHYLSFHFFLRCQTLIRRALPSSHCHQ